MALIIGGKSETALSRWAFKTYSHWVIKAASVFTEIGMLGMYLGRQKALMAKVDKE